MSSQLSRRDAALALLTAIALPGALARARGESPLQATLRQLVTATGIPGVTFAVFGRGVRASYAAGLADRELRVPMRGTTVMMGGSTGKMIVAVLVYRRIQAGRLSLEDKVATYLGTDEDYAKLPGAQLFTIAMLLSHSSGLPDGAVDHAAMKDASGVWTSDRRFRAAHGSSLLFPPGTRYSYSDLNYQVLAAVLEAVSGQTFERLASDEVLRPLHLDHTFPALAPHIPGLASGYAGPTRQPQYEGIALPDKTASRQTLFMNPAFEGGGGGFSTCSPDLAKFAFSLFHGLLDPTQLRHMTGLDPVLPVVTDQPRVAAGAFAYETALGEAFGHSGLWFGYKTQVAYYPGQAVGAALQVNSQIDASGADLQIFRMHGKQYTLIEALTQLVVEHLAVRETGRV